MIRFNDDEDDTYPPAYREMVLSVQQIERLEAIQQAVAKVLTGYPTYDPYLEPSQPTPMAIRAWALEVGLPVGRRGRIPADVILAFALRDDA